ncbi:DUF5677 domain-containing protein [Marinomonas arenicola]|uniref:DUF5677 domain-containing protein n=1 Tax=Marinomonas arenicola TaxID=569601 RepID=UPI003CD0966B
MKLCNCANSIGHLCPNPDQIGNDAHGDYSSVSSLTRDLIECYLKFYYLCVDVCPKDEWDARWNLMNLHDHMSRIKILIGVRVKLNLFPRKQFPVLTLVIS